MYWKLLIDVKPALSSMAEWLNSNERDEFINIYSVVRSQCMTASLGSLQDYAKTLYAGITSEHEIQEKEIKTFNLILSGLQYLMDSGQFHNISTKAIETDMNLLINWQLNVCEKSLIWAHFKDSTQNLQCE